MTKLQELFPLMFLINLDKRPDRLEKSLIELSKIGLDGINRLPGQIYESGTGISSVDGAIGCMLSHRICLQKALEAKSNVLIFEDDIEFLDHPNLIEIIDEACEKLEKIEWSMFYLGGNLLKPAYQRNNRLAKLNHCQSTVAYAVNYNFIEKLLSYFPTNEFVKPIDCVYADDVIPNNNCYIIVPMCVVQRKGFSDIEGKEMDYTAYLEQRYWGNLIKTEGLFDE